MQSPQWDTPSARHAGPSRKEPKVTDVTRDTQVLNAVVSRVDRPADNFDVVDLSYPILHRTLARTSGCSPLAGSCSGRSPLAKLHLLAATSEKGRAIPGALPVWQADEDRGLDCLFAQRANPFSGCGLAALRPQRRWPRLRSGGGRRRLRLGSKCGPIARR